MRAATTMATVCLLVSLVALAANGPAGVAVTDHGIRSRTTRHPGHEGHRAISHDIVMQNDLVTYGVRYCVCVDKSHAPRVAPLEGYIGMPRPTSCNWYHSGFMRIVINGQDIGTYPIADFSALDSGDRGLCRLLWDCPLGRLRVSFILERGARFVKCQVLLRPALDVKSIGIRLTCYPSFFTAYHRRKGARRVKTPAALVTEGQNKSLPGRQNWWAVYYDEVFDVARGEGDGPCAVLFSPRQVQSIRIAPGDYSVHTELTIDPSARDIRLAFAEFPSTSNADALKYWSSAANNILADLASTDFTPLVIARTDFDALARELDELIGRVRPPAAEARKLRQMLAAAAGAARSARQGDWKAEKKVAALLAAYQDALWELKIQGLFAR